MARKQGLQRSSSMPSFFKVLIDNFHKHLQIPTAFLKHFDGVWPKKFSLLTPTGRLWHVVVIKIGNHLFFEKGWMEFVQDHCLEFGDFLVFNYDRESKFYVKIYGRTACEKDMANARISSVIQREGKRRVDKRGLKESNGNGANLAEPTESSDGIEFLDEIPNCLKKRKKAPLQSTIDVEASTMEDRKLKRAANSQCFVQESRANKVEQFKPTTKRYRRLDGNPTVTGRDKARALQIANDFESENPFFVVTMQPSYVTGRALSIPTHFASEYFAEVDKNVILRASDGSSWSVKGRFKRYGSERCSSQLYCGWSTFAMAKNLKVGDVCVFELVNVTDMCLKVAIFPSG